MRDREGEEEGEGGGDSLRLDVAGLKPLSFGWPDIPEPKTPSCKFKEKLQVGGTVATTQNEHRMQLNIFNVKVGAT
jgi:hypothetical protein